MWKHPRRRDEGGFSVLETVVAAAIMMIAVGSFVDGLAALTSTASEVNSRVTNESEVRYGLDQLQRDLRAANPVDPDAVTADYGYSVQVELGPNPGARSYVRWFYDTTRGSPTYQDLLRQVMSGPGTSATVVSQAAVLTGVDNNLTNTAVFSYYDSSGDDLVEANSLTPANVANCVINISVVIVAAALPGPRPFREDLAVELRNRLPGGIVGCT